MSLSSFAAKVNDYCAGKNLLSGVSSLIVGLSGGPDSVALLSSLVEIKNHQEDFPMIYAVHVNHGIRNTAKQDEALACNLCMKLEIPFTTYEFNVKEEAKILGRGLEETGRILRYKAFNDRLEEVAIQNGVDAKSVKIVTAHHKGDLTETFMMNLFRGSGLEGLVAFSDNSSVIRPLLCVSKEEIIKYLNSIDEPYAIDESNNDSSFTRNKWRNELLPMIAKASNKSPEEAILSTNTLLSSDADFIKSEAIKQYELAVKRVNGRVFLVLDDIKDLHLSIKTRVIRCLWAETFGNLVDFESVHVERVLDLIKSSSGTKYANLAFGRLALSTDKYLGFCDEEDKAYLSCAMSTYMGIPAYPLDMASIIRLSEVKSDKFTINLPQTDIAIEAVIVENEPSKVYNTCSWFCEPGDLSIERIDFNKTFIKAGTDKVANLTKILSDLKVPRDARECLITISSGDKILWIPGVGHSEGFLSSKSYEAWYNDGNQEVDKLLRITVVQGGDIDG